MENNKNHKGFTLVELILSVVILVIIIGIIAYSIRMVSANLFGSFLEYDYQSQAREATATIKDKIEMTKAVYVLDNDVFYSGTGNTADPKAHWDYYVLSQDKKQVLYYQYNSDTGLHDVTIAMQAKEGQTIDLQFAKKKIDGLDDSEQMHSKYLTFRYVILDKNGKELRHLETEIEAKNAFKVEDERSDMTAPTQVLSFRSGSNGGDDPIVYITMVVDTSTSMTWDIDGLPSSSKASRFTLLKRALNGYDDVVHRSGLLEKFAASENLFITLVPYANTANYPQQLKYKYYDRKIIGYEQKIEYYWYMGRRYLRWVDDLSKPIYSDIGEEKYSDQDHPTYLMSDDANFDAITKHVDTIDVFIGSESASTNTGDGIRRAYYAHENLQQTLSEKGVNVNGRRVLEYMIVLLDGNVTCATWNGYGDPAGNYKIDKGPVTSPTLELLKYSESFYTKPCVLGRLNAVSDLTNRYVQQVGGLVKRRKIKSFVIGFSNKADERQSLGMIASSIGADQVYEYNDNFNLEAIFDDIYNLINIDLFILQGPYD